MKKFVISIALVASFFVPCLAAGLFNIWLKYGHIRMDELEQRNTGADVLLYSQSYGILPGLIGLGVCGSIMFVRMRKKI